MLSILSQTPTQTVTLPLWLAVLVAAAPAIVVLVYGSTLLINARTWRKLGYENDALEQHRKQAALANSSLKLLVPNGEITNVRERITYRTETNYREEMDILYAKMVELHKTIADKRASHRQTIVDYGREFRFRVVKSLMVKIVTVTIALAILALVVVGIWKLTGYLTTTPTLAKVIAIGTLFIIGSVAARITYKLVLTIQRHIEGFRYAMGEIAKEFAEFEKLPPLPKLLSIDDLLKQPPAKDKETE